jgi:hypothetical protein
MSVQQIISLIDETLEEIQGDKYRTMNESARVDQIQMILDRLRKKMLDLKIKKREIQHSEKRKREIQNERERKQRERDRKSRESERRRQQLKKKSSDEKTI